ncbi:hypothetical protein VC83_04142 [Pseudogymnoascus destructans]|uniref:Uncharacterized protein n=2 Tax=Pseudogymnoascus destructans TaxID=655981 RepID=L8FUR9_PSED2|nr:uncharacterized protein VC83_04142 [Pseudogymnoascus destructans]ELR04597.1 hypothetical protein GMDG_06879 [Pseudogymnoascus destructans 20631-21]OAF59347.1 hypothetical protein VC83_04142 [Pseudogymnoascus destructans]
MCYHRRLHFILCNHVYDLEIVRPCSLPPSATGSSRSSPSSSRTGGSASWDPALTPSMPTARCYPMSHPLTTYKVRRLCEACAVRRARMDKRVREVREGLEGVRGLMEEKGWMGEGV